jgi:hypothetical protein
VVLRFTDPDGVRQQIYTYLITYQAIRQLIAEAATDAGVDPDRLSFSTARTAAITEIGRDTQHRRDRSGPRAVKRSQARTQPRTTRQSADINPRRLPHRRHPRPTRMTSRKRLSSER